MSRWLAALFATASSICLGQGKILGLRYDENYDYLKYDTTESFYNRLKYTPLTNSSYISFGGETRYQVQYYKNEDWTDGSVPDYVAFYSRFLLHADGHLGKRFRLFGQLNSTFANGRPTPNRTIDENRFNVNQAFVDWKSWERQGRYLTLRAGRQELLYGSQRIISVREGPNNRLSFDGLKIFYRSSNFVLDVLYARPVAIRQGPLDDEWNTDKQLWGVYTTRISKISASGVDLYYLGYWSRTSNFNDGSALEERHSIGTRWWGNRQRWKYDLEALYQFGSFGAKTISAYTASAHIEYLASGKVTIGLKTEIVSGDREVGDHKLDTFNPLFPRGAYFGLAALIGPANLVDLHPSMLIQLSPDLSMMVDYDIFWRYSISDGIYGPNVGLLYGSESEQRHIGNQLGISFEYSPTQHLSISPEFTWFDTGKYLMDVSNGRDVLFAAGTIQFKF